MIIHIYQKPDVNVGILCFKKRSSDTRTQSEESKRCAQRVRKVRDVHRE